MKCMYCLKYPPYSFIWPYSFNWHLRVALEQIKAKLPEVDTLLKIIQFGKKSWTNRPFHKIFWKFFLIFVKNNCKIKRLWEFLFWWEIPLCVISCYVPSLTCSGDGANWRKIQRLKAAKHANTALKQSRHWRGLRGLKGGGLRGF